jgi:hypothetical protein
MLPTKGSSTYAKHRHKTNAQEKEDSIMNEYVLLYNDKNEEM